MDPVRTGNVAWLEGLNIHQTSVSRRRVVQQDPNKVLDPLLLTAMVELHTISIWYPEMKTAFVTRVYKIICDTKEEAYTKVA